MDNQEAVPLLYDVRIVETAPMRGGRTFKFNLDISDDRRRLVIVKDLNTYLTAELVKVGALDGSEEPNGEVAREAYSRIEVEWDQPAFRAGCKVTLSILVGHQNCILFHDTLQSVTGHPEWSDPLHT